MARKRKSEETADSGLEVAEATEEAAEEPTQTTATEAQTVLDHRAKLKQMDKIRGF